MANKIFHNWVTLINLTNSLFFTSLPVMHRVYDLTEKINTKQWSFPYTDNVCRMKLDKRFNRYWLNEDCRNYRIVDSRGACKGTVAAPLNLSQCGQKRISKTIGSLHDHWWMTRKPFMILINWYSKPGRIWMQRDCISNDLSFIGVRKNNFQRLEISWSTLYSEN